MPDRASKKLKSHEGTMPEQTVANSALFSLPLQMAKPKESRSVDMGF